MFTKSNLTRVKGLQAKKPLDKSLGTGTRGWRGVMYIRYDTKEKGKDGKVRWKRHTKKIQVGAIDSIEKGTFTNRRGRKVYGIKIRYETLSTGRYRKYLTLVTKIIELPKDARRVRIWKPGKGYIKL